jgi:hypothetical protein
METYYTNQRGFVFFLECTGNSFEGRYHHKISGVGEQAIKSMAVGKESWVWDKPREIPKHKLN